MTLLTHISWDFIVFWLLILWILLCFLMLYFKKGNKKIWIIGGTVAFVALFGLTLWLRKQLWG